MHAKTLTLAVIGGLILIAVGALLATRGLAPERHNLVIFVADGLRSAAVTAESAPALAAVRAEGVDFQNSHSIYPTVTTPNASALATGHLLGDTGDFGNSVFAGAPALPAAFASLIAPLEDNAVLTDINRRFGGSYLGETTLLQAAAQRGFSTAVVGKLGPAAIQAAADPRTSIIIDDATGSPEGLTLDPEIAAAIKAAGLEARTPDRGLNTDPGSSIMPGVRVANVEQQDWFTAVTTRVLLPRFKAARRPFILVFWSRDPDGTQHNTGDSLNQLSPGINGATSRAAIRNASNDLQAIRDALERLGLAEATDVVVTADHGFSTLTRQSRTSPAAKRGYPDVPAGFLPPGFLAIDLAKALGLPLHEPNGLDVDLASGVHPRRSSAALGPDPAHPEVLIGANGGTDALWLAPAHAKELAPRIVAALQGQDYVGGIFVDDTLGPIPGTLPTSAIGLNGAARTPRPHLLIGFRSEQVPGCADPDLCAAEVADTELQQGQGVHGAFSRADTHNFMAAVGPDFKHGYRDAAPVSNADWAPTLAQVLRLKLPARGKLTGRVMREALPGGAAPKVEHKVEHSAPGADGRTMQLVVQTAGGRRYYDAAGYPGRVVGVAGARR